MKFNAVYLVKTEEERARLEDSLELLGRHTEFTTSGRSSLNIFCAYTTYNSIDHIKSIIVAPMHEVLSGIVHANSSHDATDNRLCVSHPHSEFYRVSLGSPNIDFDIYHNPIKDFGKYFSRKSEEEISEAEDRFGSGSGLLDLSLNGGQNE